MPTTQELVKRLDDSVQVASSDDMKRYLNMQARFDGYWSNTLLVLTQTPHVTKACQPEVMRSSMSDTSWPTVWVRSRSSSDSVIA